MQLFLNKTTREKNNLFQKYFNNKEKTNSLESEKKNIRRSTKYYSINIKNKINQKMKKLEQKSKYKRNIYKLLYDQIHSDIAEIDNHIKTAKKYIVPYSLLKSNQIKHSFLFNKKISKAFIKELQKDENKHIKSRDNKIKNTIINLKNNSFLTNTTILKSPNRKDYISNTFITFSKLKNNNSPNLKTRNKPKINVIKAITDNNINIKDTLLLNNINQNKEDNDGENMNDILLTEHSNTERNIQNNIFQKVNSRTIEKNNTKTTILRLTPDIQMQKRKKTLYISYDKKWYLRNKFIYIKLDKLEIENNYIQSQIIGDQYALVNENIKLITSKYLVDKELTNKFNSTNFRNQKIININIEESIGLMIEISYILLKKYEDNLENFITQIIKRPNKDEFKLVDDEKKEFSINITLFTETSSFLTVSYKSYLILLKKDEYYKIDKDNFDKIHQYLDRLRLGVNKIILDMKNLYNGINVQEKRIIKECIQKIIKIKEQKNVSTKKKNKLDCHRKFGAFRSGIDPFKYKGKLKMKINEDKEVLMRINKALGKRNNNQKNFDNVKKFDIGSKLVTDLMKYGTNQFRQFIISERIRRKFYDKEKENNDSNDSNNNSNDTE